MTKNQPALGRPSPATPCQDCGAVDHLTVDCPAFLDGMVARALAALDAEDRRGAA
jgi:hypothetical protein